MNMNYLRYKMKETGFTSEALAAKIGISLTSFYKRTSEQVDWNCKEMKAIKELLNLNHDEFDKIFGF